MTGKRVLIMFICMSIFQWTFLFSQRKGNFGFFAGTSDYQGELSKGKIFNSLNGYSVEAFYRHDMTDRYALKGGFMYGALPTAGEVNFFDASVAFEFSFYEFVMDNRNKTFTPYIFAGVGMNYFKNNLFVPFGLGVKYNLSARAAIGAEWKMRKTFTDGLDDRRLRRLSPDFSFQSNSLLYKKDYYSSVGVFITYKFFKFAEDCPVY